MTRKYDRTEKSIKKTKRVFISVNQATYDLITAKARECGLSRSKMLSVVFEYIKKKKLEINKVPAKTEMELS